MRNSLIALASLVMLIGCGPGAGAKAKTADSEPAPDATDHQLPPPDAKQHANHAKSETGGWSEVQPFESTSSGATSKRKSRVQVSSDPTKHGDSIHFRFLVNNQPISGVFVVAGGQSTTFTLPVGTVHFTTDECEWEAQGFELLADEVMPISCKLTKEGDCCEVAIPDDEQPKPKPNAKKRAKQVSAESPDEE
jgi:hypothetical protein